ncbi:CDP-glucose 4,6-dehydratase [Methanobacterium sp. 42_16]|uniref:CDP-glucose 4,6-dehydratase n=1 Tax=Methanobacterium sp. 42_16 TaxID=1641383 RepID=UPI000AD1AAA0|nr:CDP-glucose 4,6-dehydratase [Methanobacterium sp. 42_16]
MNNSFKNIYKGRKILITGNTGFKGSWLTTWLLELGADVVGYSMETPSQPNMFDILSLDKKMKYIKGDVRDGEKLDGVFAENQPEIVFHLAAQPLVLQSYQNPKITYETNVMGTVNLLEASKNCDSVEVVINVTSDKCYKNTGKKEGYKETDPLGGDDPYSSSKACSELITNAYRESFFKNELLECNKPELASVRAGNVIGGGDWAQDRLIPDCIRSLTTNNVINIRNPKSVRPWQHVLEPLSGYLWLAALMFDGKMSCCDSWNFGPVNNLFMDVEEVVNHVIRSWDDEGKYKIQINGQMPEKNFLSLDISYVENRLGWKPIYNVKKAIEETVRWYWKYYNESVDMYQFTLEQVNSYIKTARNQNLEWLMY